jgi:hypothetical protein
VQGIFASSVVFGESDTVGVSLSMEGLDAQMLCTLKTQASVRPSDDDCLAFQIHVWYLCASECLPTEHLQNFVERGHCLAIGDMVKVWVLRYN